MTREVKTSWEEEFFQESWDKSEIANRCVLYIGVAKGKCKRDSGTKQVMWVHTELPDSSLQSADQKRVIPLGHPCLKLLTAENSLTTSAPLGVVRAEHLSVSSLYWPGWAAGTSALHPSNLSLIPRPFSIKEEEPVGLLCASICSSSGDPWSWNQVRGSPTWTWSLSVESTGFCTQRDAKGWVMEGGIKVEGEDTNQRLSPHHKQGLRILALCRETEESEAAHGYEKKVVSYPGRTFLPCLQCAMVLCPEFLN